PAIPTVALARRSCRRTKRTGSTIGNSSRKEIGNGRHLLANLDVATPGKIIQSTIKLIFAGPRIAATLDRSAQIPLILLMTNKQKLNQLRRIDEGHSTMVRTAILVENATETFTPNLDLRDEPITCRGLRHGLSPLNSPTVIHALAGTRDHETRSFARFS